MGKHFMRMLWHHNQAYGSGWVEGWGRSGPPGSEQPRSYLVVDGRDVGVGLGVKGGVGHAADGLLDVRGHLLHVPRVEAVRGVGRLQRLRL